ncbi:hypothetical protein TNCV_1322151 [Trichonephila clavipes]|nr:hypothetical protein TNCV_1322151 [Trichonephila clavipes]
MPHQINIGNVWKLLGLLYPKNTSKVSLNQCRGVWQRCSSTTAATLATDSVPLNRPLINSTFLRLVEFLWRNHFLMSSCRALVNREQTHRSSLEAGSMRSDRIQWVLSGSVGVLEDTATGIFLALHPHRRQVQFQS